MTIPAGTLLGPYRVVSLIGKGGMGEVYEGKDPRLDRKVAIKVLLSDFSEDRERVQRFLQEARMASALNHPNILSIYDVGLIEGSPYLVSELLEGETLRKRLAANKPSLSRSIEYALEIAQGLAAAHEKGVIHRDLKPENIFVVRDGHVKILDFGLAKLTEPRKDSYSESPTCVSTEPGVIMGTLSYMSPEQIRRQSVDHRSDIFSFGAILYEMFTGRRAFQATSEYELMQAIVNAELPMPASVESKIFPELSRVILHCLEKSPEERFQSVRDLAFGFRVMASALQNPRDRQKSQSVLNVKPGQKASIAVLPFSDLSPEKDQDYFCDGIAEELLNALTKIESLQVASRISAFQFRDKVQDIRTVGEKLNVGNILEGSVRKSGSKLRITVQLINVADGYHLWSEKFDREASDVFEIQDEIAQSIVSALKIKLVQQPAAPLVKRQTDNANAYNLYLKGRFHLNRMKSLEYKRGAECFLEAINRDPTYALAHAGLAECYVFGYLWLDHSDASARARQFARRAVELDDTLTEVHVSMGLVKLICDYDLLTAQKEFQKALELTPNHPVARYWYACYLLAIGQCESALDEIRVAFSLDPFSPVVNTFLGRILSCSGRNQEAIEQFHKTLDLYPDLFFAHQWLEEALEMNGQDNEAFQECQEVLRLSGESPEAIALMAEEFKEKGWVGFWRKRLDSLLEKSKSVYVSPFAIAEVSVRLPDRDCVLQWLRKAYEESSWGIVWIKVHPLFRSLSPDPRFAKLLEDLNLSSNN